MRIEDLLDAFVDALLADADSHVKSQFFRARDRIALVRRGEVALASYEVAVETAPLVEITSAWNQLESEDSSQAFLDHCRSRIRNLRDFRGTIFEMLMASRFADRKNWHWAEDPSDTSLPRVDFWLSAPEGTVAIECTSRDPAGRLARDDVQQAVDDKGSQKLADLSYLEPPVVRSVLFYDATRHQFPKPPVLDDLQSLLIDPWDALAVCWRELVQVDRGFSLRPRFEWFGEPLSITSHAVELHGHVLFARKYVEPEPTWGRFGLEETIGQE